MFFRFSFGKYVGWEICGFRGSVKLKVQGHQSRQCGQRVGYPGSSLVGSYGGVVILSLSQEYADDALTLLGINKF